MRLWPRSPDELAKPAENSAVEEFRRMRADSRVDAHRNTSGAWNSRLARVCESMTRHAEIVRAAESKIRLCTVLKGRRVNLPVSFRRRKGGVHTAEIGFCDAATLAGAAVMTGSAATMCLRQNGDTTDGESSLRPKILGHRIFGRPAPHNSSAWEAGICYLASAAGRALLRKCR